MRKERQDELKKLIESEINIRGRWRKCMEEMAKILDELKLNNCDFRKWWIVSLGDKPEVMVEMNKKIYRIKKTDRMIFEENQPPVGIYFECIDFLKL